MLNKNIRLKKIIRFSVKKDRNRLSKTDILKASKSIHSRMLILKEYKNAKNIMFYVSFGSEVVTNDMIIYALKEGKRVFVPITDIKNKKLMISEIKDFKKELEVSTYGIMEPKKKYWRIADKKKLDMVIVPGIAFDLKGSRIGYGGGYYDGFLKNFNKLKIGLSFESQIVKKLTAEANDIKIDMLITENRTIKCRV